MSDNLYRIRIRYLYGLSQIYNVDEHFVASGNISAVLHKVLKFVKNRTKALASHVEFPGIHPLAVHLEGVEYKEIDDQGYLVSPTKTFTWSWDREFDESGKTLERFEADILKKTEKVRNVKNYADIGD